MFCGARSGSEPSRFFCNWGWTGGAMVPDKLAEPGRPTNLDQSMARAYCACSRYGCGWLDIFLSFIIALFFLPLFGRRPDIDFLTKDQNTRKTYTTMHSYDKTRIPRNAMSHLLCAFTLGTQRKHQYDTYFGKINHEVLSILYFRYF